MLDFLMISTKITNRGVLEIYPKFIIKKSQDVMIRGADFYAVWIEEKGMWSTDEDDLLHLVDRELEIFAETKKKEFGSNIHVKYMWDAESGMIDKWHSYCWKQMRDNYKPLDENLVFANDPVDKKNYATKRLSYPLEKGSIDAYDKLISTLYSPEERHKIEWAIGAVVTGDSKTIQKFMVFYGSAGTGKSTILNIIQQLFEGYYSVFDAKALGSSGSQFALEAFKDNPLVAIQHDGNLSKIEDNTRLNSLISHEQMMVNEKYKATYKNRFNSFLFIGTNNPVKITDAKSGLLRRLIDVSPTGNKVSPAEYKKLTKKIEFELGAIAYHCKEVYLEDPGYYDDYIPTDMMGASNDFYNFVIDSYHIFKREDGTTITAAWALYDKYVEEAKVQFPFSKRAFKEELRNYFWEYTENFKDNDGEKVRGMYKGFRTDIFESDMKSKSKKSESENTEPSWLEFGEMESIFDKDCADCVAQYASDDGIPMKKWKNVTTKLSDLDTSKVHFVKIPETHVVIDFDIPDESGNKSFEKNFEAASKWPATYAELSKSGAGIHLHYIYKGEDVSKLSRIYDDHIEIKVFTGDSSLRRKVSKCNNLPINSISSGLPLKGDKKMVNFDAIKSEKVLRTMIKRNLAKEVHPSTKSSIDFIYKILDDAYNSELKYDITDMRNAVFAFAANSTNKSDYCIKLVNKMKFKSEDPNDYVENKEAPIVFFDIECFPNLFLINWKLQGEDKPVIRMINPKPAEVEELLNYRLIGFNNRSYDNHMIYAAMMGYDNMQLYKLSTRLVSKDRQIQSKAKFGEAFNISYTDIYDFSAKKQSLKKWEIELGLSHVELGLPWDQPVPEDQWIKVAEYCDNDVISTEAVFNHLTADWKVRQLLTELSGLTENDTNRMHITKIIFGNERKPELMYTDFTTGEQSYGR